MAEDVTVEDQCGRSLSRMRCRTWKNCRRVLGRSFPARWRSAAVSCRISTRFSQADRAEPRRDGAGAGAEALADVGGWFVLSLFGGLAGLMPFARGGVPGHVVPFASGGVVSAPSYFPLGRNVGVMGEAGAEAILPLQRSADGAAGRRGERRGRQRECGVQRDDARCVFFP